MRFSQLEEEMKTLSQRGMLRQPHNPKQRSFVNGVPAERDTLDAYNDLLASRSTGDFLRQLHPTKGFRFISEKRAVAAAKVGQIEAAILTPKPKSALVKRTYFPNGKRECARRMARMVAA